MKVGYSSSRFQAPESPNKFDKCKASLRRYDAISARAKGTGSVVIQWTGQFISQQTKNGFSLRFGCVDCWGEVWHSLDDVVPVGSWAGGE